MSFDVADVLTVIAAIGVAGASVGAAKLSMHVAVRAWNWLKAAIS